MTSRGAGPVDPGRPSVVLYTAQWCSVCAQVAPLVDQVAQRYPNVDLLTVDVEEPGDRPVPVKGVPTLAALAANGEPVGHKIGSVTEAEIVQLFEGATTASRVRGTVDSTTRLIRIGAAAALLLLGATSSAPALIVIGIGAGIWGTYDLVVPPRT